MCISILITLLLLLIFLNETIPNMYYIFSLTTRFKLIWLLNSLLNILTTNSRLYMAWVFFCLIHWSRKLEEILTGVHEGLCYLWSISSPSSGPLSLPLAIQKLWVLLKMLSTVLEIITRFVYSDGSWPFCNHFQSFLDFTTHLWL